MLKFLTHSLFFWLAWCESSESFWIYHCSWIFHI